MWNRIKFEITLSHIVPIIYIVRILAKYFIFDNLSVFPEVVYKIDYRLLQSIFKHLNPTFLVKIVIFDEVQNLAGPQQRYSSSREISVSQPRFHSVQPIYDLISQLVHVYPGDWAQLDKSNFPVQSRQSFLEKLLPIFCENRLGSFMLDFLNSLLNFIILALGSRNKRVLSTTDNILRIPEVRDCHILQPLSIFWINQLAVCNKCQIFQ